MYTPIMPIMIDSPAIAAAKARADASDYVRKYGPDQTLWAHLLDYREATSSDYATALALIERVAPEAYKFIEHLRTMRDITGSYPS